MSAFDDQFASDRIIIFAAPNGARLSPADHTALPITPDALAHCAESLLAEQVGVMHLHVRDADSQHSLSPEHYRAAIEAIRRRVGDALVLQVTTEACGRYSRDEQMAIIRALKPEAASFALRELCPAGEPDAEVARFFAWLVQENIWPQYILYSAEDLERFMALHQRGMFAEDRPSCLLVLGRYSEEREGTPDELASLLATSGVEAFAWTVCCFGRFENAAALAAAKAGGHVRIGFENNLLLCDGTQARDNAELIAQFRRLARPLGRRPASADEIRQQWQR